MQRAVDHLDLPVKKQRPWTESRIRKAGKNLRETVEIAHASSKPLAENITEEWFDIHWDEGVANLPRLIPDTPKKTSKKESQDASRGGDAV